MNPVQTFRAVIEDAGNGGAFITIPFDVEAVYGRKRVKVKAMIGGEPYRGSLVRMGSECHILGVRKDIREKIGKTIGDEVEVVLEEDTEPREVEIPPDLLSALQSDPETFHLFQALSYTHQKEYAQWIEEARLAETRASRVEQTLKMLKQGKKEKA